MMTESPADLRRHLNLKSSWSDKRINRFTCDVYVMGGLFLIDGLLADVDGSYAKSLNALNSSEHGIDEVIASAVTEMQSLKLDRRDITDPSVVSFLTKISQGGFIVTGVTGNNETNESSVNTESSTIAAAPATLSELMNVDITVK